MYSLYDKLYTLFCDNATFFSGQFIFLSFLQAFALPKDIGKSKLKLICVRVREVKLKKTIFTC